MILEKLRTPNGKKFLLCAVVVFTIAVVVVGRATFGGVVREYNLPYAEWTTGMFVLQGAMAMVYSSIFTILCSIPLGFYFLGSDNQH
ncbi:TPA: DUF2534 family protein [Kluyvera ascorbata]|nr:DUF2534 family protein [Kluyvera ascorbata]